MVVLLDLDSVLNELCVSWYGVHNRECKTCDKPLRAEDVTAWDVSRFVQCGKRIYQYLDRQAVYTDAPVMPGAIEATRALAERGHDLYVVTASTGGNAILGKIAWLRKHFPHIHKNNMITAHNKALIHGDVLVDDRIDNHYHGYAGLRVIFDQPWNRTITYAQRIHLQRFPGKIVRCTSWEHTLTAILTHEANMA